MDGQNDKMEEEIVDEQAGQPTSLLPQQLFQLNVPRYVVARHVAATQRSQRRCTWSGAVHICLKFKFFRSAAMIT